MIIGVVLSRYQHRVYVIPRDSDKACHWEGLGWIGKYRINQVTFM